MPRTALKVPTKSKRYGPPREFIERFTATEMLAIANAILANAQLNEWYQRVTAGEVWLDHPEMEPGLTAAAAAGLLDNAGRVAEILTPDFK